MGSPTVGCGWMSTQEYVNKIYRSIYCRKQVVNLKNPVICIIWLNYPPPPWPRDTVQASEAVTGGFWESPRQVCCVWKGKEVLGSTCLPFPWLERKAVRHSASTKKESQSSYILEPLKQWLPDSGLPFTWEEKTLSLRWLFAVVVATYSWKHPELV